MPRRSLANYHFGVIFQRPIALSGDHDLLLETCLALCWLHTALYYARVIPFSEEILLYGEKKADQAIANGDLAPALLTTCDPPTILGRLLAIYLNSCPHSPLPHLHSLYRNFLLP